jgi:hypothetical protein
MCIIAYKPLNVAFPEEKILQNCFENNSDGAGFMYSYQGEVHIKKGYQTFKGFMNALNASRAITGDKVPYVMHFRIATQGYEKTMTHPFPLSGKMNNLKKLKVKCNIGVAHNGILDITSDGSHQYSDTMKFITDYLSLIIRGYDWYEDKRTCQLIERLIEGSRLAILDKNGHCELMGKGWEESDGVHYSNHSWAREPYKYVAPSTNPSYWSWDDDWYCFRNVGAPIHSKGTAETDAGDKGSSLSASQRGTEADPWADYYSPFTGKYYLDEECCPMTVDCDESYCSMCSNGAFCYTKNMNDRLKNTQDELGVKVM